MMLRRRRPFRFTFSSRSRSAFPEVSGSVLHEETPEKPIIALRGVRSSWLMFATNSLFALLASWAFMLFLNELQFRQFPALDFFLQHDVLVKRFLKAFMVLLRLYRNKEKIEKGEETEFNVEFPEASPSE